MINESYIPELKNLKKAICNARIVEHHINEAKEHTVLVEFEDSSKALLFLKFPEWRFVDSRSVHRAE